MQAPIPREPPVTIATLPSSLMPCLPSIEAGTIACAAPPGRAAARSAQLRAAPNGA